MVFRSNSRFSKTLFTMQPPKQIKQITKPFISYLIKVSSPYSGLKVMKFFLAYCKISSFYQKPSSFYTKKLQEITWFTFTVKAQAQASNVFLFFCWKKTRKNAEVSKPQTLDKDSLLLLPFPNCVLCSFILWCPDQNCHLLFKNYEAFFLCKKYVV